MKELSLTVAVPGLKRPPPALLAELLVKELPLTVAVPKLARPPPKKAESLEKTLLLTANVPKLSRPPPVPLAALPPLIVRPEMFTVSPRSTVKIRKGEAAGSRCTVEVLAPRPVMVMFRLRSGRTLSRVIVPDADGSMVMT